MPRRIVGQCHQSDFAKVEHLAIALQNPEMLDMSTLTNKQKFAFHFIALIINKKIPWRMLAVVREVLFWGDEDHISGVEVKFVQDTSKISEIEEFRKLFHS